MGWVMCIQATGKETNLTCSTVVFHHMLLQAKVETTSNVGSVQCDVCKCRTPYGIRHTVLTKYVQNMCQLALWGLLIHVETD